jgi:hypothetical protein
MMTALVSAFASVPARIVLDQDCDLDLVLSFKLTRYVGGFTSFAVLKQQTNVGEHSTSVSTMCINLSVSSFHHQPDVLLLEASSDAALPVG